MKNNWEIKTLGEVCEVVAGQSPESRFYNKSGKGLPFYQGKKDFGEKYIENPTVWTEYTTKEALKGDILMSVRAPVGPTNFATQRICIGRGLAAIRSGELLNKDYLFYFFIYFGESIETNQGAVFSSINKKQIENIKLPVPPLPQQIRIVKVLDEKFGSIEELKKIIEQQIVSAKELFESRLSEIFSNPIWEEKVFEDICVLQRGFDLPTRLRVKGEYPLMSANGVTDYIDQHKVSGPGVTTGRSGSIGFIHYIVKDFWPLNTALYIKDFKGNISKFIYYFLKYFNIGRFSSGAGVPTLNRNHVHSESVKFTDDIEEQIQIVKELDELSDKTKELEAIFRKKIADLEELKKSYLQDAFAGKL